MKDFLIKLFLFSLIIGVGDYCWNNYMSPRLFVPNLQMIFVFFVAMTLLFHLVTLKAASGRAQDFIRFYMGSTAIRMVLCVTTVLAYNFIDKPTVIPFALAFLAHYFLFTIFEVALLLNSLKN